MRQPEQSINQIKTPIASPARKNFRTIQDKYASDTRLPQI